jgi:hypothetical protein
MMGFVLVFYFKVNFQMVLYHITKLFHTVRVYFYFIDHFDFPKPRSSIPYNINFVQCGFTKRSAFEERNPNNGQGFAAWPALITVTPHDVSKWQVRRSAKNNRKTACEQNLSVRMFKLENGCTDLDEIWYRHYVIGVTLKS